jgi:uncharacterized membrane protein HdeD (DUF308 family)
MNDLMQRSWWVLAIRGAAALIFGILAIAWPDITLLVLVAFFAAYAFITGVVYIVGAVRGRQSDKGWWMLLLLGLVAIAAGAIAVFNPAITALVLVLLMGANALVTGILDLAIAIRLRKEIRNEWMLILTGIVSIVFGVLVFLFPGAGALAMVWMVSFYAVLTGVLLLTLAFRLRGSGKASGGSAKTGSKDRLVGA